MSEGELEAIFDRMEARYARINALLEAILDHLDRWPLDVPLHQRGFGVMGDANDGA